MTDNATRLRRVKTLHTIVWAFFALCVVGILVAAARRALGVAAVLIGLVALETLVLAFNHWRCPLTDVAARYTDARHDDFDIYLPLWLARYNKHIFGALYAVGIVWTVLLWMRVGAA
ncbi:MAG: hypothetical protein KA154_10555 [Gemmatimonadaceae bacterium]|nr:hypothetical protein [Gemmatimonadaceae bacterium]